MVRKFWIVSFLLLLAMFSPAANAQDKSYDAQRFDVEIQTQPDGSLLVEENVTFRFQGGPFSYVFREIPTDHTDGVVNIVAGADGVVWPLGTGPGQVEISGNNPIEVVWHLSPTANTTQTFTLTYQPLGVVRQNDETDRLDWQALPDDYDYTIGSSRVTFIYPADYVLQKQPEVLAGEATVEVGTGQTVFTMQNLDPGDPLVTRLSFAPDTFTGSPPAWQTTAETQNSRAWIWVLGAVAALAGGLLAIIFGTRPRYSPPIKTKNLAQKPPIDLPPALAGYLFSQQIGWQHGLATLFVLAGRGLIEIEEIEQKKWYQGANFTITLLDRPAGLVPHEEALLDLLFTDKAGNQHDVILMSEMGRSITSSRWKGFSETLKADADKEGMVDHEAILRGKRMAVAGVILMFLALPLMGLVFLFQVAYGFWPILFVGAVFLAGMFITIAGATVSSLSQRGAQVAAAFDPFRRYLQDVTKGKAEVPDPAYYEAYLPFAAAFGIAEGWVKQQHKAGYDRVPAYFRAMSESSGAEMVVFLAAISAASNSGGAAAASAAGAAGAGAAGGGASGAG